MKNKINFKKEKRKYSKALKGLDAENMQIGGKKLNEKQRDMVEDLAVALWSAMDCKQTTSCNG